LTPLLQQQANMDSIANVNQVMGDYNSAMDKLTIAGNLMNEQMNLGSMDPTVDANVEKMLTDLKMEVTADINKDFMGVNQNFNYQDVNQQGMNTQDTKMKGLNI